MSFCWAVRSWEGTKIVLRIVVRRVARSGLLVSVKVTRASGNQISEDVPR